MTINCEFKSSVPSSLDGSCNRQTVRLCRYTGGPAASSSRLSTPKCAAWCRGSVGFSVCDIMHPKLAKIDRSSGVLVSDLNAFKMSLF